MPAIVWEEVPEQKWLGRQSTFGREVRKYRGPELIGKNGGAKRRYKAAPQASKTTAHQKALKNNWFFNAFWCAVVLLAWGAALYLRFAPPFFLLFLGHRYLATGLTQTGLSPESVLPSGLAQTEADPWIFFVRLLCKTEADLGQVLVRILF